MVRSVWYSAHAKNYSHGGRAKVNRLHVQAAVWSLAAFILYLGAYQSLSCPGKRDSIAIGSGTVIWTFQGCRQQVHHYTIDPRSEFFSSARIRNERMLLFAFYPLVRFDRLRGHFHLMDTGLPEIGG